MFPYNSEYARVSLARSLLKGDISVAKHACLNLRSIFRVWLEWNLPILAAECLSFVPEDLGPDWNGIATIALAKKSRAAYSLARMFHSEINIPIVKDFRSYMDKGRIMNSPLFKHLNGKPASSYTYTLAYAVEFLDPLIRFRSVEVPDIKDIITARRAPWWSYPIDSSERGLIYGTTFHQISLKTRLHRGDYNRIFNFLESEYTPPENHVDYEQLWEHYRHSQLGDFINYDFSLIQYTAQWVGDRVGQFFLDQELKRAGRNFNMVGEE